MEFVDRKREQDRLRKTLASGSGKLIVIYGRRRLGKSTLIKRILSNGDVYYEAVRDEPAVQMRFLLQAMSAEYPFFAQTNYADWEALLNAFNTVCHEGSTLVLDEFPYLVEHSPSLPSMLQRLLGNGGLRFNLIICGSSQRMMQKLILDRSEPLYGRADERINLQPVNVKWWMDALGLDAVHAIEEYSVWGGVPRYWVLRERYANFEDAMRGLLLDEQGLLYDEPASLFMDDISDFAPYSSIMSAIGSGSNRFSSIANVLGRKTTEISKPVSNLLEMGFIRKDVPWGEREDKSKKTLYETADPFMSFYYRFMAPNRSAISFGRGNIVEQLIHEHLGEHIGHLWERLCQIAVSGNEVFGIKWNIAKRWWGRIPVYEDGRKTPVAMEDLEFDVVAESLDRKYLLVGECKWTQSDFADRLMEKLMTKIQKAPFIGKRIVIAALFLREEPKLPFDGNILLPSDVIAMQPE